MIFLRMSNSEAGERKVKTTKTHWNQLTQLASMHWEKP